MNYIQPAEACTELGADVEPRGSRDWRRLLLLCAASWAIPLATLAAVALLNH